jgi:predicted ester cyclase
MGQNIRELSRQWFEQAWNQRADALLEEMISPDAAIHGLAEDGRQLRGPKEFAQFRRAFLSAFDDLHLEIQDVLADGDKSVVRFSFSATHTGQGLPIAPTGRRFTSTAMVMLRWRGRQIIEAWNEFDAAGMMRQLAAPQMSTFRVAENAAPVELPA